ncbi:MAG: hypothetical protein VX737_02645 [Pseudomonadota bacterium]|nr:hypothetical protein [Pseudomonadota bacterium]
MDRVFREIHSITEKIYSSTVMALTNYFQESKKEKSDQLRLKNIILLPPCIYTDNNPKRAPEYLAEEFRSIKMRQWLYENPNHSIFKKKQTTALHILVRLMDVEGIKKISAMTKNPNETEIASGLTAINLLTDMKYHKTAQNFSISQKNRYKNRKRNQIFEALCKIGCEVNIECLIQIAAKTPVSSLLICAVHYFYKNKHQRETKELIQRLKGKINKLQEIKQFNEKHITQCMNKKETLRNSQLLRCYTEEQIKRIQESLIKKLTQVMLSQFNNETSQEHVKPKEPAVSD